MKTLRVVVRTVEVSTYETEVEDAFGTDTAEVHDLFYEEGFTWPRAESEIIDESIEDYEFID